MIVICFRRPSSFVIIHHHSWSFSIIQHHPASFSIIHHHSSSFIIIHHLSSSSSFTIQRLPFIFPTHRPSSESDYRRLWVVIIFVLLLFIFCYCWRLWQCFSACMEDGNGMCDVVAANDDGDASPWMKMDWDFCWSYVHLVISFFHSITSSIETRNPYVMVCITVKKTRSSLVFWFSPLSQGLSEPLCLSLYCATLLRVSLGYFDTADNELLGVEIIRTYPVIWWFWRFWRND